MPWPTDWPPVVFYVLGGLYLGIFVFMIFRRIYPNIQPKVKLQKVEHYNAINNWDINSPIIETVVPPPPDPPSAKWFYYLIAVAFFIVPPLVAAKNVDLANPWTIGLYLVLIAVGVKLFKLGHDADETHAKNMAARAEAQRQHAEYERARIVTANAAKEAQREAFIKYYEDKTKLEQIEAQRLMAVKMQNAVKDAEDLRPLAQQHGVTPEAIIQVNTERLMGQVEAEKKKELDRLEAAKRREEIKDELDAGDRLQLAEADQIELLRDKLEKVLEKRYQIAESDKYSPEHKDRLLARYDKDIQYLEARIDALQDGLLLPENGQKARGATQGAANGGANYPASASDDEDEA